MTAVCTLSVYMSVYTCMTLYMYTVCVGVQFMYMYIVCVNIIISVFVCSTCLPWCMCISEEPAYLWNSTAEVTSLLLCESLFSVCLQNIMLEKYNFLPQFHGHPSI